jgi:hypothetical protein
MLEDATCHISPVVTCVAPAYCSTGSAVCSYPPVTPVPSGDVTGHLQAKPALVAKGATTQLYWNMANVNSCTVTGNGNSWSGASGNGLVSNPILQQATYTLTCIALDNSNYIEKIFVDLLPVFQEK